MVFIYSQSLIHQFMGLFETNIMTSPQMACLSSVGRVLHTGRPEPFFRALVSLLLFISSVPYCKDCFAVHTYHFHNIHSRQCYSYGIKIKLSVTSDNGILSKLRDPSDTFQNFKSNSVSKLCSSSHVQIEDVSNQALYLL